MSKLPKPLGLKQPQFGSKILSNRVDNSSNVNKIGMRRSKSYTDIRTMKDKPLFHNKKPILNPKSVTTRQTVKRNAVNTAEASKPKVAKTVKIPDWDYKSRFTQLQEQHNKLKDSLSNAKDKETLLLKLQEENNEFNKKVTNLKNENTQLEEKYKKEKEEREKFQSLCETKSAQITKLEALLKSGREEIDSLKNSKEILFEKHSVLQFDYNMRLKEKGELQGSLQAATNKIEEQSKQIASLVEENEKVQMERRYLHNALQDLKGNIRVYCRIRPPISSSEQEKALCDLNFPEENAMEIRRSRETLGPNGKFSDSKMEFNFDKIFPPNSTQTEIFEELSQLVQSAVDGYNVCIFAYGQTGSGKTYTMQGRDDPEHLGMIPRTITSIFDTIKKLPGWKYTVKASFLEIYNENIRDLLNINSKESYEIRYNEGKGTTVTNLTIKTIKSAEELIKVMAMAHRNRAVAATNFNEHSSRSHAVTKIYLEGVHAQKNIVYTGSINLVDLAGSESAKSSAAERLTETKNINKSLTALGNVMLALYTKATHTPFRNSKLTYLLQSSLGGNSKTLMIVNISPFEECFNESVNSLRFAAKVKEVKLGAKKNVKGVASIA